MRDQHKLRFPLLSDPGNRVARQFGLTYRVPEEQKAIYQRAFVNLPFVNGDDSWQLPIPATYVIDRDRPYSTLPQTRITQSVPSQKRLSACSRFGLNQSIIRAQPFFRRAKSLP